MASYRNRAPRAFCLVALFCTATAFAAEPEAAPEHVTIFSGGPRLLLVNGYSTSFQWWAFLQRKVDRYLQYEGGVDGRAVEVQSVTKGGTPIAKWMDAATGERSPAWKQMLTPTIRAEKGKRPVIILAQQSLQWAFGERGVGINGPNDRRHIEQGADVLQRYAKNLLDDGAAEVIIAMHIYKKPMEPRIGNEWLALAELTKRDIAHVHAGPDVWQPTSKQHPLAFDRDQVHPNFIGAEIMAHYWFARLLELDGLPIPDWSRQEMKNAIQNRPLGLVRDQNVFQQKLKEWKIVNRRPAMSRNGGRGRSLSGRHGAGRQVPPAILQRFDKDGDGKLNDEERAEFEKARARRNRQNGGHRQAGSRILQRYDKDGDGKLNEEERAAFEKARRQHGGSRRAGGSPR